ncbi:MAG TPA: hypothetical protein VF039_04510 [Longimicrobiales bacterium]
MRSSLLVVSALLALLCARSPAAAQQPITRSDSADVLVGTAERLHARGSDALAEALATLVGRRYADTPAAARANALLATLRAGARSGAGRVGLVAYSTIYGAWLGVAVPLMFEADRPQAYGLGLLTGAPLGFFGGRWFAHDRSISGGDAGLIAWSGVWGTWQGGGWMGVLGDRTECSGDVCYEVDADAPDVVGATVIGGLLGTLAAAYVADRIDVTGGTATMIGWSSLWGSGAGLVASVLADLDGDEVLAAALIGGDAGFATAAALAPRWDMSSGRAWLVNAAGVMGGAIGGGVDLLIEPENDDVAILIPTIGAAAGLGLGAWLTRDMDEGRMREGSIRNARDHGALLGLRDGDWSVALPIPAPVLLESGGVSEPEAGVRVQLIDARF